MIKKSELASRLASAERRLTDVEKRFGHFEDYLGIVLTDKMTSSPSVAKKYVKRCPKCFHEPVPITASAGYLHFSAYGGYSGPLPTCPCDCHKPKPQKHASKSR